MSFYRAVVFLVTLASIVDPAVAQSGKGTISGVVTDPSGAALQGVVVEALDPSKRAAATALTDSAGRYTMTAPAGIYELRMRLPGFSERSTEWRSTIDGTETRDAALEVAPLSERIAVTTALPLPKQSEVSVQSAALPTSVTVINHDEIARTNIERDAGNMFRRVPGIQSHNIDQGETGTSIKMRGFLSLTHGADVAVYIDGVPQNVPSSAINHGMDDLSWLTPDMVERIEVIKGPFSALYGDQNRSGAVNIITRSSAPNSVGATAGNYGNDRGSIVLSGSRGSAQGLIVADIYRNAGYRDHALDNRGTLFAKVSVAKGSSIWGFRGVHYKANWDAPGFLNLNSVLAGTVKVTDRDPTVPPLWGNGNRTSFVFTRIPARGEAGLYFSASVEDYSRTRAVGANQTDLNVQADDRRIMTSRVLENLLLGPMAEVAFGAEVRRDRGDSINRRWPSGSPGPNYTFNQDLNLVTGGFFAQGQFKPFDKLKLLGGLRFDGVHHDIANRKLPDASVNYKQSVTTPRGGFVVTPVRALDLFANVGQGWRTPNQTEISPSGNLGPLGAPGGAAFPNLAPPKVTSYDFGATVQLLDNRWKITAAKYHTLNQSEIVMVAPNVFDSVGNTSRDGWELESRVIAGERLSFYGSLGEINKAKINNPLPNTAYLLSVPHDTVKAGFAYTTRAPNSMLFNADFFYISGIPYFTGSPLVLKYSRGYTRFDLRATYPLGKTDLTTFATFEPLDYISEGANGAVAGLMYDPRPKAQVGMSIRYRF